MEQTNLQKLPAPLLAWYDEHRRVLPWREQVSPYRTWVSEIMLQQTRVQAVLPYFQRFMEAAPDVQAWRRCRRSSLCACGRGWVITAAPAI